MNHMQETCDRIFADHTIAKEVETKTFRLKNREGKSSYWFDFTWIPGTVTISGDVGELTIQHYQALADFKSGMEWLNSGDFHYLVGKVPCDQRVEEFQPDSTYKTIIRMLNEEAKNTLKGFHEEMREYWESLEEDPDPKGEWKPSIEVTEYKGTWDTDTTFEAPYGFEMWLDVWKIAKSVHEIPYDSSPNMILTAKGRRALKEYIRDQCQYREYAAEFCSRIEGLDDYYGDYDYPSRLTYQITAAKKAAAEILKTFKASPQGVAAE